MRSNRFVCAVAASMLALAACSPAKDAKPATQAPQEPVAATVNGTPIPQKLVDLVAKRGVNAGRPDTPEARATIVDQLVMQIVLADEAVKKGLDKTPDVEQQMATVRQSVLATAYVEDYLKNNPISDEVLQAEYQRIKERMTGDQYRARHILVETEAEAKDIIAKLKKDPASFAKLATARSKDPNSKDNGGDLGWFDPSRAPPEFAAAVHGLEKGKFTLEPVKTQLGYHVILLEDSKPIEAPPLDDVKVQLTQQIQQQNLKKQMDALKAVAKIDTAGAAATTPPAGAQ